MSKATKTLNQIKNEGYVYPGFISEDLRGLIDDWFGSRIVCDDDYFPLFFNRVLARDYKRYHEILRIEPGYAEYDWLVQHYTESQRKNRQEDSSTRAKTVSNETTGTSRNTVEGHDTSQGSFTGSVSNSGTSEDTLVGRTTDNDTYSSTRTPDITVTINGTGTNSESKGVEEGGGYTDAETTSGQHANTASDLSVNKQAIKAAPMSIQSATPGGTSGTTPQGSTKLAGFDWTYASQIQQTDGDATHSDSGTDSGTKNLTHTTNHTEDTSIQGETTKQETSETTGTETIASTDQKTGTVNNTNSGEFSTQGSQTQSTTGQTDSMTTLSGTTGGTLSGTENDRLSGTTSGEDTLRSTGRSTSPQQLLDDARRYIQGTSAWVWFMGQLEVCFLGVYDI